MMFCINDSYRSTLWLILSSWHMMLCSPASQACRTSTTCTPTALRSRWSWAVTSFLLRRPYPESGWATGRRWSRTLSRLGSPQVAQRSEFSTTISTDFTLTNNTTQHNTRTRHASRFQENGSNINRGSLVEYKCLLVLMNNTDLTTSIDFSWSHSGY